VDRAAHLSGTDLLMAAKLAFFHVLIVSEVARAHHFHLRCRSAGFGSATASALRPARPEHSHQRISAQWVLRLQLSQNQHKWTVSVPLNAQSRQHTIAMMA
jgi:hypothetical protein